MKTRRFTLRAVFAAAIVVAVIASIIPTNGMPSASIPPIIWGAAISIGLVYSDGRGRDCLVFSTIAGVVGSMIAALFVKFSSVMSFGSWMGPIALIGIGGIGGCVVGILVRLVMEGLVFRNVKESGIAAPEPTAQSRV